MRPSQLLLVATLVTMSSSTPLESPSTTTLVTLDERGLLNWIKTGLSALSNGANLVLGVANLASSTIDVAENCNGVINCFVGVADTVWNGVTQIYDSSSNTKRSDGNGTDTGLQVYGMFTSAESGKTFVSHMPSEGNTTLAKAAAASKSRNWVRAATVYAGGQEVHHLMYRLASDQDLGHPNDGNTHHFRVLSAGAATSNASASASAASAASSGSSGSLSTKREDSTAQDLTVDMMWQASDQGVWSEVRDFENGPSSLAQTSAQWMQQNNAQVACAVPAIDSYGITTAMDQQLMSYNVGSTEYNYNGQAGGYLSQCGNGP